METKKKVGRPSDYSEEIAEKICALIRSGLSERKISQMDEMPSIVTMWAWKNKYPEFLKQSAQARRDSAEMYADMALDESIGVCKLSERVLNGELADSDGNTLKDLPRGVLEAKKIFIQEMRREAGIRDDSRFGDRKTVKLDEAKPVGNGMSSVYEKIKEIQNGEDQ